MLKFKDIFMGCILLFAVVQTGFSQWENDGKGLNYKQLYGCQDTTGVRLDSMFRMTDSTGKLTICLSIGDLIDIINNYGGDGGGGGGGTGFGCDSVEICLEDGLLCDILKGFPTGNYTSGNRLFGVDNGGMCKRFDIMSVPGVGDTCRVVNNTNGSYSHFNENNRQVVFGYHLVCKNDSTLVLTDWDGTRIDSCTISPAGGGGGGGGYSLDCDSVKLCLENGILCEVLSGLDEGNTEEGDKYVTIKNGQCVLTDSVYIDICGILQEIQEESDLAEDDIAFILRGQSCFKVPISTRSTDCINLQIDAGDFIATPNISGDAGNIIECRDDGFYAAAVLDFNCDSLNNIFTPGATADSVYASNGGECVKVPMPSGGRITCDTLRNHFGSGTFNENDHILAFDGTTDTCEWVSLENVIVSCDNIKKAFNQVGSEIDTLFGINDGVCTRVALNQVLCDQSLPTWSPDCGFPYFQVQCDDGAGNFTCMRAVACDLTDYLDSLCALPLRAPFSPSELQGIKNDIKEEVINEIKSENIQPSAMHSAFGEVDYPTVDNLGIRTFKSKRQAELSNIPIGGIYYISGKGTMQVKTRQRK